ncbi:MAG: CPBP family intramembrane metalloprotease [Candidatus Margulisbacteria bacterium]|nr:CPBP family intramembrane metalloprotease [Candidatus Margulisiibacteriota bacterium]
MEKTGGPLSRRTSLWSWIFALIYPLIWFGIIIAIALAAGLGKFNADALAVVASWPFLTSFITMVLIMAPVVFGEEYGWRGYLLPELDKKHGRVWATVITGLVWGLWHIPSYYITYSQAGLGNPILLTAIAVIFVTVGAFPYTYLFYLNGNLLPCVLFHAVYDKAAGVAFFSTSGSTGPGQGAPGLLTIHWPYVLGLVIVTGSVLAVFLAREFVKSNFGSPERFQ